MKKTLWLFLLVATPDNPLEDARALARIDFVMKNGQVIRQPK